MMIKRFFDLLKNSIRKHYLLLIILLIVQIYEYNKSRIHKPEDCSIALLQTLPLPVGSKITYRSNRNVLKVIRENAQQITDSYPMFDVLEHTAGRFKEKITFQKLNTYNNYILEINNIVRLICKNNNDHHYLSNLEVQLDKEFHNLSDFLHQLYVDTHIEITKEKSSETLHNNKDYEKTEKPNQIISSVITSKVILDQYKHKEAVIVIGKKGLDYFIIEVDNYLQWKLVKKNHGLSMMSCNIHSNYIRDQLAEYIDQISEYGIDWNNIHFVMSSSLDENKDNYLALRKASKELGINIQTVTPQQEGNYGLLATVPQHDYINAFFIDIGSGTTKIAWFERGKVKTKSTLGALEQNDNYFLEINHQINDIIALIPIQRFEACYVIGGVVRNLTKDHPDQQERIVVLDRLEKYQNNTQGSIYLDNGYHILSTIQKASNCQYMMFDTDANFGIGYILNYLSRKKN